MGILAGIAGRAVKEWGGPSAPQTEEQLREAQIQEGALQDAAWVGVTNAKSV